jgi:hypothetical protein
MAPETKSLAGRIVGCFVLSLLVSLNTQAQTPSITLDGTGAGRVFEGFGGVSGGASSRLLIDYPEPYRSQILDYLFKPNYGASLQHLKIELGGDVNSTDGSEPSHMHGPSDQNYSRGYEWWLMQQAKLRNPNITLEALEWGAPGWIGGGQFFSQDNINYILNFINAAKSNYGLTIDEIGIWNETNFDVNWIIALKAALQQAGLSTRVIAADQASDEIVNQMVTYSTLMSAVDIVGIHYPRGGGNAFNQPLNGKSIWASEEGPWRGDWIGAGLLAKYFNRNYIGTKITLTEIWSPVTSYYDFLPIPGSGMMYANTPWSGVYNVQPAIWAAAHTTQFAQPGWRYIDSSSGYLGTVGSYVTLTNGSDYSLVVETIDAGSSQTLTFNITGGLFTGTVHVWKTDVNSQFVQQSDVTPAGGSFTFTFAPGSIYSLTTTTGQSKGSATPPPASAFPFPYDDNFDSYAPGQEARYFSALNGSFEIVNCGGGRSGFCLRQAVNTPPIAWHSIGPIEPATVMGSASWTNYQVSADVLFEQAGYAKLIGRLTGVNVNSGDLSAYQFYVGSTGNWILCHGNSDVLSSGSASFSANSWHTLTLIFNGSQIQGLIDGALVTTVTDTSFPNGMVGLGVQTWTNVQFDNFRIDLLPGASPIIPQSQMTATATSQASGQSAYSAIDGDPTTYWITDFSCVGGCAPVATLPQSITLALGGTFNVSKLRYLPRQDGDQDGTISIYNVYVSTDGVNFTRVATGNWAIDATEKSATFTPVNASYIQLEAAAGQGGYASASEINVEISSAGGNPAPFASSLTPGSAAPGSPDLILSVEGSNFVNGAIVQWNGASRPTTFASSTALTASIPASDLTTAGTASVTVFNPAPGGGTSNAETFTIVAPSSGGGGGGGSGGGGGGDGSPASPYITGFAAGGRALRNDFTGWVGAKLTVGSTAMSVSSLGRICIAGNTGTHTVKLVNAGTRQDVASAQVNMAGCSGGQFVYSALSANVSLAANASYYLATQEAVGGDQWYNAGPVPTTSDAVVNNAAYSIDGTNFIANSNNASYVPPNLQYSTATTTSTSISATVQSNLAGTAFLVDGTSYSSTQVLTWTSGSAHTIAVTTPQSAGAGAQYVWTGWSDGGASSHTVTPTSATTFTATFATQYLLTTGVTPAASGTIVASPSSSSGYYNSGTSVQLTSTASTGYSFINWSGDVSGSASPQNVSMTAPHSVTANFQPASSGSSGGGGGGSGGTSSAFVTGYATIGRPLRSDFSGWVGMQLTVGTTAMNVSALGRVCIAGNSAIHTVKLVNAATRQDVTSVQVNMASCAGGQFVYGALPSGVTLPAGGNYYLATQEAAGGDQWYEFGPVSTTPDATVNSSVYSVDGANWIPINSASTSYVPPNLQYSTSAPTLIAVTVQTSLPGSSFLVDGTSYSSTQVLNWPSGSSHTIAVTTPQSAGTGTQYIWTSWSDGGASSHQIAPTTATTYTLNFATQYLLTTSVSPASSGSVAASPSSATGYYNSGTPVQLTAILVGGNTFLNWGGDASGSTNPQTVTMTGSHTVTANFQPPASGGGGGGGGTTGSPFVAAVAVNGRAVRSDFSGWVGMKLTVGEAALNVSSLGRICIAGNSLTHTVKLVNAGTKQDVASAQVTMSGCAAGQFVYSALSGTVTLSAGTSYYLVSQEAAGNDQWYDFGPVSSTSDAAVNNSVYSVDGASWIGINGPNTSYVPPNFQYVAAPPDPSSPFVTAYALNAPSPRNDFAGWVGMKLTIGASPVTVSSLGRICVAGNSGTHTVKFVNSSTGQDVAGGSASLNMSGCVAGQFLFSGLASPITLQAGVSYYLATQEIAGGDLWYDLGDIATASVASVNQAVYGVGTSWFPIGSPGTSYVPPNFK